MSANSPRTATPAITRAIANVAYPQRLLSTTRKGCPQTSQTSPLTPPEPFPVVLSPFIKRILLLVCGFLKSVIKRIIL